MKKLHLALSTRKLDDSIEDYSARLGCKPDVVVPREYALWRTAAINLSIRVDEKDHSGALRHLGWEDPSVEKFITEVDANGITWELFTAEQQAEEINDLWPGTDYSINS